MTALLHPGVYVQEIPSGVRSIEGVPTSTTIFVGETERGPLTPVKIKGVGEYERYFGGYLRNDSGSTTARVTMRYAVDAFFRNGGSTAYILRAVSTTVTAGVPASPVTATRDNGAVTDIISASSPGVWGNGLRVFFTVSSDEVSTAAADRTRFRVLVFAKNLSTTEFDFVEDWDKLSFDSSDENFVEDVLPRSQYIRWKADATIDLETFTNEVSSFASKNPANFTQAEIDSVTAAKLGTTPGTAGVGGDDSYTVSVAGSYLLPALDGIDDAALIVTCPDKWLDSSSYNGFTDWYETVRTYVDNRPKLDLFFVADLPRQQSSATTTTAVDLTRQAVLAAGFNRTDMAAVYWPHLEVLDPVGAGQNATIVLPPSSTVAGLFARTDARRGVWKAPAGTEVTVGGIKALEWELLDKHQDDLNPQGVNCIRPIPGAGTVIWGARTLRPSSEWRYVPVRRTAMFLRKSIYNGIQWAVFEPNDDDLWTSLRATIGAFMETQFRNGAFAGTSSREAYFVKCDSETTTEIDQAAGIVNILVGFAPLRPAEFVVVKLSQKTATAA